MLTCAKCGSGVALPSDPRALSTSCGKCGSSVDLSSLRTIVDTATPPATPAEEVLETGRQLAGYRVEKVLGRGGMAVVYKATQLSLNRPVAIKTLPKHLASSPAFVTRFNREAGALAALNHPNIINIIDRGVEQDLYYFVMEFVDGEDLQARLKRERPSPAEAVQILRQVLAALDYAHKRGVIHRDIKPGNIMIDRNGTVKVTDFGIAHLAGGQDTGFGLTMAGAQMGTVNYMAPEQRTDAAHVDGRADLYAVGVVLYEMLTGQLPLGAFDPPEGDPRLTAAIMRALKQDPKARFASAQEMAAALGSDAPVAVAEPKPAMAPCPFCKAENRTDAKFCVECGKTLIETCPRCRKAMRAQAKFCDACGTNVTEYLTRVKEDLQTKLTQAEQLGKEGRLADAITELDSILTAEGKELDDVKSKAKERKDKLLLLKEKQDAAFKKGQELYDRRDFEKAIAAWEKLPSVLSYVQDAISEARKKIDARRQAIQLASAAHSAGRFEEALREWQKATDLSPDPGAFQQKIEQAKHGRYVEIFRRAGEATTTGKLSEAESLWSEALRCKPNDPTATAELQKVQVQKRIAERDALLTRADQSVALGKHREAIDCWQKALTLLVPDNPPLRAEIERKLQASRATHKQDLQKLLLVGAIGGGVLLFLIVVVVAIVLIASGDDKDGKGGAGSSRPASVTGASSSHELFEQAKQKMRNRDLNGLWSLHSSRYRNTKPRDQFDREAMAYFGPWNPEGFQPDSMEAVPGEPNPYRDGYVFAWTYWGAPHAHFMVRNADGWWLEGMIE